MLSLAAHQSQYFSVTHGLYFASSALISEIKVPFQQKDRTINFPSLVSFE